MNIQVTYGEYADLLQEIYHELNEKIKLGISDKVVLRICVADLIARGAEESEIYEVCYNRMEIQRHNKKYEIRTQEEFAETFLRGDRDLEGIVNLTNSHTSAYTNGATVHRVRQTATKIGLIVDLLKQEGITTIQDAQKKYPTQTTALIGGLYDLEQITEHYLA